MGLVQSWDTQSIEMIQKVPSKKPVISHYPPARPADLEKSLRRPAPRICGPVFAESAIEAQIVRQDISGVSKMLFCRKIICF